MSALAQDVSLPITTSRAVRLIEVSGRKSLDPFREIDWSVPFDDSVYYLPPEILPLHGTAAWDALSERKRREYSRHEAASLCAAGIWLENILMSLLVDHLYETSPGDPIHHYLLIEVGDECRHSSMFGEFIRRAATPDYAPTWWRRLEGRLVKSAFGRVAGFIAILAAEELLDALNRVTMADRELHPVSREIARIHVVEEARHVSFARTYLTEAYPRLSWAHKLATAAVAPLTVAVIAGATINAEVFKAVGIRGGYAAARRNRAYREVVVDGLRRLTEFLRELGVITRWTLPAWQRLRLM